MTRSHIGLIPPREIVARELGEPGAALFDARVADHSIPAAVVADELVQAGVLGITEAVITQLRDEGTP